MSGLSVKVAIKQEFDGEEGGNIWKAEVKDWGLKAQDRMLELFNKLMERCEVTGENPEDLLAAVKKKSTTKKGKEANE